MMAGRLGIGVSDETNPDDIQATGNDRSPTTGALRWAQPQCDIQGW